MGSNKIFYAIPTKPSISSDHTIFEFDESEPWNSFPVSSSFEPNTIKKPVPSAPKKVSRNGAAPVTCAAASLPLSIPDWSKIYRQEEQKRNYRDHGELNGDEYEDGGGGVDGEYRVPPHEVLARRRGASFSVHEGIGRTLKGRDLRQVRNAIWEKVGFED